VKLPQPTARGNTHPTFVELTTNRALYVHRRGSNVLNGEYYADADDRNTLAHYAPTRRIDVAELRRLYEAALRADPQSLARKSPLAPGQGVVELPRYFAPRYSRPVADDDVDAQARAGIRALNSQGFWPAPLSQTSHPYQGPAARQVPPGDFASTYVGDETDTSPFPDGKTIAISTAEYLRNMNVLIRALTR